jgi:hypothetical protein
MSNTLSLPELYAISQSHACIGTEKCHWCNSPCGRVWLHDDPPPQIGVKRDRLALNYPSPYVCVGCWLWRRASITAFWLTDGYRDRQKPVEHSWLITEEGAWAVRREDADELYANLLDPPRKFALALIDGDKMKNHPQMGVVNELPEVKADTPLRYTLNGIVLTYTVYELEEMRKANNGQGKSPGVQALVRLFGKPKAGEKKGRGRPRKEEINIPQKVIRQSA